VTCEAAVGIPMLKVCAVVILSGIGSYGLERSLSMIMPSPSSSRDDVIKEGVEVDMV
jgi:hypothetical protein